MLDPNIAAARQEQDARKHAADHNKGDQERKDLNRRLAKARKELRNIEEAIKSYGHSKTLFASLAELEKQETSLLTQLSENNQANQPQVQFSHEQLAIQAAIMTRLLENGAPEDKRAVLHGIIQAIKVENIDKRIKGIVFFYSPIGTDHPPPNDVSLVRLPPGAPRYIHSIEFNQEYKKTRSGK